MVAAATVDTPLDGTITNTFGALRAAQEQGWLLTSCVIGSGGAALDDLAPTTAPLLESQDSGIDYDFALEGIEGHTTVSRWKNLKNPECQLLEAIEALQVGGRGALHGWQASPALSPGLLLLGVGWCGWKSTRACCVCCVVVRVLACLLVGWLATLAPE